MACLIEATACAFMLTRLAPSPTGALHLGNARTFLFNWLMARRAGWKVVLRIEDLDGPRVKTGADQQAITDLQWLGLDWDLGPIYQSARFDHYRDALARLITARQVYPCICSRREIERAASAPHAEDGAAIYPGSCRDRFDSIEAARAASGREPAIRFRIPSGTVIEWTDAMRGPMQCDASTQLGDFAVAKADGTPAYQLAVVIDDAEMGVTQVIRGDDLIDSTPRQIMLYRALGLADCIPTYRHLPLVVGPDGRRLAKRHGDTRLTYYQEQGVAPRRLLALLARWCGIDATETITLDECVARFQPDRMPLERITFGAADDQWLRQHYYPGKS